MFNRILTWVDNNQIAVDLICLGLTLQFVFAEPHSGMGWYGVISTISGILGVFAVVLCSNRKLISYVFGIAQILTYLFIVWHDALYAKVVENIFYLITMFIGVFIWRNHYDDDRVETKQLSKKTLFGIFGGVILLSCLIGYLLSFTNDSYPYLDSFTTLPAFVAQILMITRYREQWIFWILIDIGCLFLWWMIGNPYMVAQYIFWIVNCIYGWHNWKKV